MGNLSPVAASSPVLVQNIDPGTVFDGGVTGVETSILSSTTSLQANWSGFSDPNGTIVDYQWSIGTYPGGSGVFGRLAGLATAAEADGLSLSRGQVYYVTVQAFDDQGLTSSVTSPGASVPGPAAGMVYDGANLGVETSIQFVTDSLTANWSGFTDATSDIIGYQLSIGTSPGASDVLKPTASGSPPNSPPMACTSPTGRLITSPSRRPTRSS